ncbi:MAG: hypothetical protein ACYDHZ_04440, partial [Dehalococcoidia bacterium]
MIGRANCVSILLIVGLVALLLFNVACQEPIPGAVTGTTGNTINNQQQVGGSPDTPIPVSFRGSFSLEGTPKLNNIVDLTLRFSPVPNSSSDIKVLLNLPSGLDLVEGKQLQNIGDLNKGQEFKIQYSVKVVEVGEWLITAHVSGTFRGLYPDQTAEVGQDFYTYFLASADSGRMSYRPTLLPSLQQ